MSESVRVKFCGLTESADIPAALLAGASYVGFVFFPKSARHVALPDAAFMAQSVPAGITRVALTVNADDAQLDALVEAVPVDMLQLHGSETPQRVAEVRARYGLPVMKAVGVSGESDLVTIEEHARVADQLLIDAKAPAGSEVPGGHGIAFDWRLIADRRWGVPWMLAGGLTAQNVAEAMRLTGARQVDVSSGVESSLGVKDAERMLTFGNAARSVQ